MGFGESDGCAMKYIMISRKFPKGHMNEGQRTRFVESILQGKKIHTIRGNAYRFSAGETVSLRVWDGQPYRSKQIEFAKVPIVRIEPLRLVRCSEGMRAYCGNRKISVFELVENDGLTVPQAISWFFGNKRLGEVFASIIHFTDFTYGIETTKAPRGGC